MLQTEERKQKAIQLDLKEVKAKKLNLTESMKGMQQKATILAKQAEVKKLMACLLVALFLRLLDY